MVAGWQKPATSGQGGGGVQAVGRTMGVRKATASASTVPRSLAPAGGLGRALSRLRLAYCQ